MSIQTPVNIHRDLNAGCGRCEDGFDLWYHYQRQRIVYQPLAQPGQAGCGANFGGCEHCHSSQGDAPLFPHEHPLHHHHSAPVENHHAESDHVNADTDNKDEAPSPAIAPKLDEEAPEADADLDLPSDIDSSNDVDDPVDAIESGDLSLSDDVKNPPEPTIFSDLVDEADDSLADDFSEAASDPELSTPDLPINQSPLPPDLDAEVDEDDFQSLPSNTLPSDILEDEVSSRIEKWLQVKNRRSPAATTRLVKYLERVSKSK